MKVSENTSVSMPIKNMVGIIVAVAMGIFAYTEVPATLEQRIINKATFMVLILTS